MQNRESLGFNPAFMPFVGSCPTYGGFFSGFPFLEDANKGNRCMPRSTLNSRPLVRMLSASPLPIYVLDAQRSIVFANPSFGQWTDSDTKSWIGRICSYHTGGDRQDGDTQAAYLCPPPETFLGNNTQGNVSCCGVDGQILTRRAQFIALSDQATTCPGVIAIVYPNPIAATDELSDHIPLISLADGESATGELHDQIRELRQKTAQIYALERLVGNSPIMHHVRQQIDIAILSRTNTLIWGPSGVGKQHIARTIHCGDRLVGSILPCDCTLLDVELLKTTLTAFMRQLKVNKNECHSLLLLDVDRLSDDAQRELVEFVRGQHKPVRTLATSTESLGQLAERGQFRTDLAFILSPLSIGIPPLSKRQEDIPLLVQLLLEQLNSQGAKQLSGFTPEVLDRLSILPWKTNVDQMLIVVKKCFEQSDGPYIELSDLPDEVRLESEAMVHAPRQAPSLSLDKILEDVERTYLERVLKWAKGNKTRAAKQLNWNRTRLHRRLQQLGLEQPPDPDADPVSFIPE